MKPMAAPIKANNAVNCMTERFREEGNGLKINWRTNALYYRLSLLQNISLAELIKWLSHFQFYNF